MAGGLIGHRSKPSDFCVAGQPLLQRLQGGMYLSDLVEQHVETVEQVRPPLMGAHNRQFRSLAGADFGAVERLVRRRGRALVFSEDCAA